MKIEIQAPRSVKSGTECRVRAVLFNDSYEPIVVSRNAFVGPNVKSKIGGQHPRPESVEPTFGHEEQPLTLEPFTFYGRERSFDDLERGDVRITAYYREAPDQPEVAQASVTLHVE